MSQKDRVEAFLTNLPKVVADFADGELKRIASKVRGMLCHTDGLPHVDSIGADTLWHQYCDEIQQGPSPIAAFWEHHIDSFIEVQVEELSRETALLVSSAVQWERDELSEEGEIGVSTDLLKEAVRAELHRLALDEPSDEMQDEFEDSDEQVEPLEPEATKPPFWQGQGRSFEVARQNGPESRSILIEFPASGTVRMSAQDMGPFVQTVMGDEDYEFWVDVDCSALPKLAALLLQEKYKDNLQAVSDFRVFCEREQIQHKYMTF